MSTEAVGIQLNLRGRRDVAQGMKDTRGEITGLGDEAEKTASRTSRAFAGIGRIGKRVGAAAVLGIGAVTTVSTAATISLLKTGIAYNQLEQRSRAAFTTILGSGSAANDMMDKVREFGKTSPFPRQAFIEATQQLLGFGFTAESIIPTLKTINDTVAATGGDATSIATLTDVFAKIKSQGKITGEEVNRMGALGIDAVQMLADAAGVSGDKMRKGISAGAVGADDAIAVLTAGMNKRFGGASDNVKKTWGGAVDRVKGAWRDLGSALAAPFVDPMGGGLAVRWANKVADKLRVIEGMTPGIIAKITTGLIAGRGGGAGGMASQWEQLGFYIGRAGKIVMQVDWAGLFTHLGSVLASIPWDGIQDFFSGLFSGGPQARSQLTEIGGSLGALKPAFAALAQQAPTLSDVLTITAGVLGFLADHVGTIVALMPFLVGAFVVYRVGLTAATIATKELRTVQLVSTITSWRQVSATRANAAANMALAREMRIARGATDEDTVATRRNALVRAGSAVKTGVLRLATLAWSGATKAAAGAQWLLNSAMSANPIGLIVVGLIALAAGAVWAYKHVSWFHDAVDSAWHGVQVFGGWLADLFLKFTPLGQVISHHAEILGALKVGFDLAVAGAKGLWDWIKRLGDRIAGTPGIGLLGRAFSAVTGLGGIGGGGGADVPEGRATGGPVRAGTPYVVGEQRPELFIPRQSGVIVPRLPEPADPPSLTGTAVGGGGDLHVTLELDGREMGRTVVRDFRRQLANR